MNIVRRATGALVAVALLWPIAADAQLSKVGTPFVTPGGASAYSRTSDTGYDSAHGVFLTVVSEHYTAPGGRINASFANTNGTVLTAAFRVDTTGNFPFGPALAYSPEDNVFLVVWTVSGGQLRGRLVRYGVSPNALGSADFAITGTGVASGAWAPAVAYSPATREFLVAYAKGGTRVARVSTAGTVLGLPVLASVPQANTYHWTESPALAWNPTNDEFLLTYAQEFTSPSFWQIRAQRIKAGQLVGGLAIVHAAGSTKIPDVQYSTQAQKYLVTWFQGSPYGIHGRMVNANLTFATAPQPMLPSNYGSYDANSLAYNSCETCGDSFSHKFAVATITPQFVAGVGNRDTIGGAEISTAGVPSPAMRYVEADSGNRFFPEIDGSSTSDRFFISLNKSHGLFYGQVLKTAGGNAPPPPPPPQPTPTPPPPTPPSGSAAITAAEADFSGDSKPDLLWRHDNGAVALWTMNGTTMANSKLLGPGVNPAWRLAGTGDLNGDGKPEILWQHQSNLLFAWFMGQTIQGVYLTPNHVDSALWKLVAVADMNADKKADLVWQHDSGSLVVWYMNGTNRIGSSALTPASVAGNDWKIVGAGDFSGDLKPDLVWQQTSTNLVGVWIMNGITRTKMVLLPNQVQAGWKIRGVVDLNGDGNSDLVWRHDNGQVGVWLMKGTTATIGSLVPGAVGVAWDLAGPK